MTLRVVVVGSPGSGKTELVRRLVHATTSGNFTLSATRVPTTTETTTPVAPRAENLEACSNPRYSATTGSRERSQLVSAVHGTTVVLSEPACASTNDRERCNTAYRRIDVAVIVFAHDDPDALREVDAKWVPELRIYSGSITPILLVATQADRNATAAIPKHAVYRVVRSNTLQGIYVTSAATGLGINTLFADIVATALRREYASGERPLGFSTFAGGESEAALVAAGRAATGATSPTHRKTASTLAIPSTETLSANTGGISAQDKRRSYILSSFGSGGASAHADGGRVHLAPPTARLRQNRRSAIITSGGEPVSVTSLALFGESALDTPANVAKGKADRATSWDDATESHTSSSLHQLGSPPPTYNSITVEDKVLVPVFSFTEDVTTSHSTSSVPRTAAASGSLSSAAMTSSIDGNSTSSSSVVGNEYISPLKRNEKTTVQRREYKSQMIKNLFNFGGRRGQRVTEGESH